MARSKYLSAERDQRSRSSVDLVHWLLSSKILECSFHLGLDKLDVRGTAILDAHSECQTSSYM